MINWSSIKHQGIGWGRDSLSNKWWWDVESNLHFTPQTKIILKCITDLNVKAKTKTRLDKYIGQNLCNLGLDKDFLVYKSMIHKRKRLMNWMSSRLKPFSLQKTLRPQTIINFCKTFLKEGLVSRIYKELL